MKYCKKCVMPDTKPDLSFDEEGVCDACRSAEKKHNSIDWNARLEELKKIVDKYRCKDGSNYDCIVPVSGGKDSTFQTWFVKEKLGLNPLCVTFEPTLMTEIGRKNLENLRKLGVDLISIEKNPMVYKKIGLECFKRVGDHEWPNHVGIFTAPVKVAVSYNVPLIVWGENSQLEYGGPATAAENNVLNRRWLEEFGGLLGNRVEDMVGDDLSKKDLLVYDYPSDEDIRRVGVTGIFLGYYVKWDAKTQVEKIKKLGFNVRENGPVEGTYINYENLDCGLVSIHDYMKYVKFGFGRTTDHACLDIRNNRLNREDALRLVKKYDGKLFKNKVKEFCDFYGISENEFFEVVDSFTNPTIFKMDDEGKPVRDEDGQLINLELQKELERCDIK
jgi:N-acetyl sugar amidotransferase